MTIVSHWNSSRYLRIQYTDKISDKELLANALEISGDPRFDDLRVIIGDWSGAEESTVSEQGVEQLVAYISAMSISNPHITHLSIMYQGDETRQAMVNLFTVLTQNTPWTVKAFHSLEEGLQCLEKLNIAGILVKNEALIHVLTTVQN